MKNIPAEKETSTNPRIDEIHRLLSTGLVYTAVYPIILGLYQWMSNANRLKEDFFTLDVLQARELADTCKQTAHRFYMVWSGNQVTPHFFTLLLIFSTAAWIRRKLSISPLTTPPPKLSKSEKELRLLQRTTKKPIRKRPAYLSPEPFKEKIMLGALTLIMLESIGGILRPLWLLENPATRLATILQSIHDIKLAGKIDQLLKTVISQNSQNLTSHPKQVVQAINQILDECKQLLDGITTLGIRPYFPKAESLLIALRTNWNNVKTCFIMHPQEPKICQNDLTLAHNILNSIFVSNRQLEQEFLIASDSIYEVQRFWDPLLTSLGYCAAGTGLAIAAYFLLQAVYKKYEPYQKQDTSNKTEDRTFEKKRQKAVITGSTKRAQESNTLKKNQKEAGNTAKPAATSPTLVPRTSEKNFADSSSETAGTAAQTETDHTTWETVPSAKKCKKTPEVEAEQTPPQSIAAASQTEGTDSIADSRSSGGSESGILGDTEVTSEDSSHNTKQSHTPSPPRAWSTPADVTQLEHLFSSLQNIADLLDEPSRSHKRTALEKIKQLMQEIYALFNIIPDVARLDKVKSAASSTPPLTTAPEALFIAQEQAFYETWNAWVKKKALALNPEDARKTTLMGAYLLKPPYPKFIPIAQTLETHGFTRVRMVGSSILYDLFKDSTEDPDIDLACEMPEGLNFANQETLVAKLGSHIREAFQNYRIIRVKQITTPGETFYSCRFAPTTPSTANIYIDITFSPPGKNICASIRASLVPTTAIQLELTSNRLYIRHSEMPIQTLPHFRIDWENFSRAIDSNNFPFLAEGVAHFLKTVIRSFNLVQAYPDRIEPESRAACTQISQIMQSADLLGRREPISTKKVVAAITNKTSQAAASPSRAVSDDTANKQTLVYQMSILKFAEKWPEHCGSLLTFFTWIWAKDVTQHYAQQTKPLGIPPHHTPNPHHLLSRSSSQPAGASGNVHHQRRNRK